VIIRPLSPGFDWGEYADLTVRSFGPMDETRVQPGIEPIVAAGRCLGAFDGDRLVGAALYHDMRQWWHGRPVRMAGVAGVKIAPEYRRQGAGRALMAALAELMAEHGYPLSVLYPATMPLYRSLGWEIAGHRHEAALSARALSSTARSPRRPTCSTRFDGHAARNAHPAVRGPVGSRRTDVRGPSTESTWWACHTRGTRSGCWGSTLG